ncbi:MAG: tyrosine-type recombinase/integrase [Endomicrobiales bacterium]|nr:tyrosine-type recombinase/integrase [Endomicrobiales bacterium]
MEVTNKYDRAFENAQNDVIKIIKNEFDSQQKSGFQHIFKDEWRSELCDKLVKPFEEVKKQLFLKRREDLKNPERSEETTKIKYEQNFIETLKSCIRRSWTKIRFKENMRTQTTLGQQLIYLASDDRLLGAEAFRLKLQYYNTRRLVVNIGTEKDMGLENAIKIRDHCVFGRFHSKNKTKKSDNSPGYRDYENDCAAVFGIVLLWEGLTFKRIGELFKESFDCSKGRNLVFLKTGNTFINAYLSKDAWAILGRLAGSMPRFFGRKSVKNTKKLLAVYPNLRYRMKSILRAAGEEEKTIPSEFIAFESFRQMGIYYKLKVFGCKPAYLADIATAEQSRNVLSPSMFYPDYNLPKMKAVNPSKNNNQEKAHVEVEEEDDDGITLNLEEYFKDSKENIDKCHRIIYEFAKDGDREKALSELDEHIVGHPDSRIAKYARYLVWEAKTRMRKKLVSGTANKYFSNMKELFIFRILSEQEEIDEAQLVQIMSSCNTGDNEAVINVNTLRGFRSAYGHYETCLRKQGITMPEIRWIRMKKYGDKTRRLIVIPEESKIIELIDKLIGSEDAYSRDLGMIIALEYYLGMRSKEAYSFECIRLRCIGENEHYIEITGAKFGKSRRVDLEFLPVRYRKLLISMAENALEIGKTELFGLVNKEKYKYRFDTLCRKVVVSGQHSLRHAFAIKHILAGMEAKKLASIMGHETLRVLRTYDQSAYYFMKEQMYSRRWEKEYVTQDEAKGLLHLGETQLKRFMSENKITPVQKEGVYRRGGGKVNQYGYSKIIDACFKEMEYRTSQIKLGSREAFIWKNYSRKKMSREQKKRFWSSLKQRVSSKQGYRSKEKNA